MDIHRLRRSLLLLAVATAAAGFLAATATGAGRVLLQALMIAAMLALVPLLDRAPTARPDVLGGAGYHERLPGWVRTLHLASTVVYTAGIMVVVLAVLLRFRVIDLDIDPAVSQAFPLFLGAYVALQTVTAQHQIGHRGAVAKDWSTRLHAGVLVGVAGVVLFIALLLVAQGSLEVQGQLLLQRSDVPILVLIAVLGGGTQLFLAAGLPTSVDLLQHLLDRGQREEAPGQTPPVVYAALLAIALAAVFSFLASQLDLLDRVGRFRDERVIYIIAVVPLALVTFFAVSAISIYREGRRGLYKKRITVQVRNALMVYGFSSAGGILFFTLLAMALGGRFDGWDGVSTGRDLAKDLTVLTVLATTGPIGWYLHRQNQRIDAIEMRLPDFLNDLAESRRAGLTLSVALQVAAKTDYGALRSDVRKMANQVAWGVPFNEALEQFAKRVPTALVRRTTQLVIEASHTGGSIADILKAAARDAYDLKNIESERRVTMTTYLVVLYVVFFVFMVVLAALDTQFIPGVLQAQEDVQGTNIEGGLGTGGGGIDASELRFAYFNAAMVQAIGNGLVSGVLGEGRVTAGFRHVAIMTLVAWVMFRLVLGSL